MSGRKRSLQGNACLLYTSAFAEASGIPELKKTTRDEPDYDKLMNWRLGILKEHGLGLKAVSYTHLDVYKRQQ